MKTEISIKSDYLTPEELRGLLQVIRTAEQRFFPDKAILILVDAPDMKVQEVTDLLASLNPPLPHQLVLRKTFG